MYQRILLLNRLRIGDCIFTTPAVRALRHAYPDAQVAVVVPAANVDLFAYSPHVDAVIRRPVKSWWGKVQFFREMRRQQFDLVVSFQEKSIFYALTARLSGARDSITLHHRRTRLFYRRTVPWPGEEMHRIERYLTLARAAGAPAGASAHTELYLGPEHRARAGALLGSFGVKDGDLLVALNPGSTERTRRWDPAHFAAVGDHLARETGTRILLLGGTKDRRTTGEIAAAMRTGPLDLSGQTSLLETGAVLERCALLVSGDTGPVHIAAALGTPVVTLFGPSDPRRAAPRFGAGGGEARILRSPGACSRCSAPCLHTISPEMCAEVALDVLQKRPALFARQMIGAGGVREG